MDKELISLIILGAVFFETSYLIYQNKREKDKLKNTDIYVDTSALMDGRIVALAKAGFILGDLVIPQSVIKEMQLLADGSDHQKRSRARHGMDVAKELKNMDNLTVKIYQDAREVQNNLVDDTLIYLAKKNGGNLMTVDFNLNKVAQVAGINVLNVNELAQGVRAEFIPGEQVEIKIIQKGQESGQGVGYTEDGTMVVVDHSDGLINKKVMVELTRVIQTEAGKMMFAKRIDKNSGGNSTKNANSKEVESGNSKPKGRAGGRLKKIVSASRRSVGDKNRQTKSDKADKNHSKTKRQQSAKNNKKDTESEIINLINKQED